MPDVIDINYFITEFFTISSFISNCTSLWKPVLKMFSEEEIGYS